MLHTFILCAGAGSRLRPYTDLLPKALVPVAGKPVIRRIVNNWTGYGGDLHDNIKVTLCVNEKDLPLYEHEFRDYSGLLDYSTSEVPLGTAGNLSQGMADVARKFGVSLQRLDQVGAMDLIAVVYGDDLMRIDRRALEDYHRKHEAFATLLVTRTIPFEYGVLLMDEALQQNPTIHSDRITRFQEKPLVGDIMRDDLQCWTGTFITKPAPLLGYLGAHKDIARDVFPAILKDGHRLSGYQVAEPWMDVGSIYHWEKANEMAKAGLLP